MKQGGSNKDYRQRKYMDEPGGGAYAVDMPKKIEIVEIFKKPELFWQQTRYSVVAQKYHVVANKLDIFRPQYHQSHSLPKLFTWVERLIIFAAKKINIFRAFIFKVL